MFIKKILIVLIAFLSFSCSTFSQGKGKRYDEVKKKALEYFQEGKQAMAMQNFEDAKAAFQKAIDKEDKFIDAYMYLGKTYEVTGSYDKAEASYKAVLGMDEEFDDNVYLTLAELMLSRDKFKEADNYLNKIIETSESNELIALAENYKKVVEIASNPVPFDPKPLGDNVNSDFMEYIPAVTADEQMIIFTRRLQDGRRFNEDFFMSIKKDSVWQPARNLGSPVNTPLNEGAQSISPDGKAIYYTICNGPDGLGSCDIYVSKRNGNNWSRPLNLGYPVNTSKWESQPSISADGNSLYFSSGRKGTRGKYDIWVTHKDKNGRWAEPENLGPKINTGQTEQAPFIHPDGHTLYFTSDGHPGMGKQDIFYIRKDENGNWGEPVNIGYPINSIGNESSLFISTDGKHAYFASDRIKGVGDLDLYYFDLYEEARPLPVTYVKGEVFDEETGNKLQSQVEVIELESGEIVFNTDSDPDDGVFLATLPAGKNYALNVSKPGYLFYSDNFSLKDHKAEQPFHLKVPLSPIKIGESVVLKNIFYATDSFALKPESKIELNKLITFLNDNPSLQIEISGHTDNRGSDTYNKELSKNRAKSVVKYLTDNEINPDRLTYKGYGETQPIASNDTEEGRAKNRRTEFKVIGK